MTLNFNAVGYCGKFSPLVCDQVVTIYEPLLYVLELIPSSEVVQF